METHKLHAKLLEREVRVLVVGCGGTGSAMIGGLPYLHLSMLAQGHPYGLCVTVMDGDEISPANSIRQPFSRAEIGLNKAIVLVNRINIFWGLNWEAVPAHLSDRKALSPSYDNSLGRTDFVIGCVDTRAARSVIRDATANYSSVDYWLDIGNNADSGQFIFGEPLNQVNRRARTRLRTVAEWFPEIVDARLDNDGLPSCSAAEAIERQEPFVNQTLAQHALGLLARLFRYGITSYYGGFVNVASGACTPLPVDPRLWARATARRRREWKRREANTPR